MENKDKPLSPHLQVYRWHISSLLSIAHRIVGVITKSMENNEVEYIRKAKHLTSLRLNYTKDIKVKRNIYIRSYTKTVNNNLAYSNPIWIE